MLIVAVVWLIEPQMITNFLSYHTDRPLQIESVPSSILYLLSMLGLVDVEIQSFFDPGSFGSDNLIGPLPDAVAEIMMPLMIILILAVYALYAWARGRTSDEGLRLLGFAVVAALMLFMVANKVFSSQYLVWIAAPVAFLVASRSGRTERRMFWLTVLTLVLTQLNFAYNIGYLGGGENINDLGMMVILARNIAAIGVTCLAVAGMYRCVRPAEPSPDEACHARRTVIARRAR